MSFYYVSFVSLFFSQSALSQSLPLHAKHIKRPTTYHVIQKPWWGKPLNTLFITVILQSHGTFPFK